MLSHWPAAASQSPRVLAVLPFADLEDPGGQTRYLSVGIAEDLERDLSQVPGLRLHTPPPTEWLAPHRDVEYPALARTLGASVLPAGAITVPALRRPPENPKAHDLYLQGRNLWALRTRESAEHAIQLFRQTLAIDPNYALADMGIADAYVLTAALGLLKGIAWDYQGAAAEYSRAIALNPSYDRAYIRLGTLRFSLGDFAGAEKLMREAETLNPYSMALPMIRAELYYYARRYQDAIDLSHEVLRMDAADQAAPLIIARTLLAMGKPGEALANALRVAGASDHGLRRADITSFQAAAGQRQEALAVLDQVVRDRSRDYVDSYDLAVLFARPKDRGKTIEWVGRALAERSPNLSSAHWDPVFDFVRGDPRFAAVLRQVPRPRPDRMCRIRLRT